MTAMPTHKPSQHAPTSLEHLWFLDTLVTVHVAQGPDTNGISILESLAPHGDAPPLHVHRDEDEAFHVIDGELLVRVGDEQSTVAAGETVLAPRAVPHTYRVTSREGARWLIITRGGFERFVRAAARPAERPQLPAPSGPPTPDEAAAFALVADQHGIDLIGPPLAERARA
jgi:mannose-6-phosphate isomerase-like protein (cupin superfamily)